MVEFTIFTNPAFYFGQGSLGKLPDLVSQRAGRVLFLLSRSFSASRQWKKLRGLCSKNNVTCFDYPVHGEPSPELIDEICGEYRESGIDLIVGIGGGSVLDTGKAVAAMMQTQGKTIQYLEGVGDKKHPGISLPFIAVPSTSGTGSEATKNAVLSSPGREGFKKSLRHNNFIPVAAVVDPELTEDLPQNVLAACAMDAFSQLTEAYVSKNANPYTDALAISGIQAAAPALGALCDKQDLSPEERSGLSYGAYLSGIVLANAGLGTVHGIAGPLGGYADIPHGVACGKLLAPVIEQTFSKLTLPQDKQIISKFENLGIAAAESTSAEAFIHLLWKWSEKLELPGIGEYGITEQDLEVIAGKSGNKNNPVVLEEDEIIRVLKKAL